MIEQLTQVDDITDAKYVTIGKLLQGITVGKVYELLYGQAIGFDVSKSDHEEYYFINDDGKKMTLMGVWNLFKSTFYK